MSSSRVGRRHLGDWQVQVAQNFGVTPWQAYLGEIFLLYTLYFWLMAKFDEGVIFWTLLLLGLPLVFCFQPGLRSPRRAGRRGVSPSGPDRR